LEGWIISYVEIVGYFWQSFIRLSHFIAAVGVCAVLTKATLALFKEVLALLCLEVVVRYVHHLELNF
jgi:hypothetical protein